MVQNNLAANTLDLQEIGIQVTNFNKIKCSKITIKTIFLFFFCMLLNRLYYKMFSGPERGRGQNEDTGLGHGDGHGHGHEHGHQQELGSPVEIDEFSM